MYDPPSLAELVAVVRDFLEQHAMPKIEGRTAFHARVAAIFDGVAFSAMQTTALMPCRAAASATPCAWLPAEEQMTPRRFCSSLSCANLFIGPRIL